MSVETKKVLEMLAAGKITSEDAERLLDKLAAAKEPAENNASENQEGSGPTPARKYLRILVQDGDAKDVNVRVPLAFVRSGVGLDRRSAATRRREADRQRIQSGGAIRAEGRQVE